MPAHQGTMAGIALAAMLVSGCLPDPANPNSPNPASLPTNRPQVPRDPAEIVKTVRRIIAEHLGVDEAKIVPEAKFTRDLGADSLDQVELTMAFEEEFNLEISEDDACKMVTVKDVTDYITQKVNHPKG